MTAGTQIDQASIANFNGLVTDLQRETGRSAADAVAYAGGRFLQSCSAAAKPGIKMRKVISNPLFKPLDASGELRKAARALKGDMRRARFGVMKFQQGKPSKFVPIYRTGEYGRVRFIDKKTGQMRWRSKKGKLIKEVNFIQGEEFEGAANPSIKTDKRRIIKRSGLARKIFRIMRAKVLSGESIAWNTAKYTGERYFVFKTRLKRGNKTETVLSLNNALTYITNAYPTILQTASAAAISGLRYELGNQIAKRTAQAIAKRRAA